MLTGALLGILEQSGTAVMILVEDVDGEEFFASRLTRRTVEGYLTNMAESAANLPKGIKEHLAEIDWAGWSALRSAIKSGFSDQTNEAVWFAIQSLVPATLLWLRVYRQNEPQLFAYTA